MYAEAIKAIVERRNIRWLVHFTHINNLLSILDRGIIPRQQLEQEIYGGVTLPTIFYLMNPE